MHRRSCLLVAVLATAAAVAVPTALAGRLEAAPLSVVTKAGELPGWKPYAAVKLPSQDIIRGLDTSYPATMPRVSDGAVAQFGSKTSALTASVALAKTTDTARIQRMFDEY